MRIHCRTLCCVWCFSWIRVSPCAVYLFFRVVQFTIMIHHSRLAAYFCIAMEPIVNKVAESGIITLDLTKYMPPADSLAGFDLRPFLFREMILREKDFRESLKTFDWSVFSGKHVHIHCSVEAIIPMWANMLVALALSEVAVSVHFGSMAEMEESLLLSALKQISVQEYIDKRVVIKGCGDVSAPPAAYVAITGILRPFVRSLMYGEPCSTVPVYKKKS